MTSMDLFQEYDITVTFGARDSDINGMAGPTLLDIGEYDLVFLNPSPISYTALNGLGPYDHNIDLRNIAVFPSWDRLGFAVKKSLGITSLREIVDRRIPINLSTRGQGPHGSTVFAVTSVLSYYGLNIDDIEKWGGHVDRVPVPQDANRLNGLKQGTYDAVFDEGIDHWVKIALENGMTLLPLEDGAFDKMEKLGFWRTVIPEKKFTGLTEDVPAVEFGGWPLCCRADLPEDIAYHITKAIDDKKKFLPTDRVKLKMSKICKDTDEGPFCVPLHPGADKYYREHDYL